MDQMKKGKCKFVVWISVCWYNCVKTHIKIILEKFSCDLRHYYTVQADVLVWSVDMLFYVV